MAANLRTAALLLAMIIWLGGCSRQNDAESPYPTAATLGPQTPQAPGEYLRSEPFTSADPALGDRLLMQCRACHSLAKGGPHMLGPNLHGVFGRRAGSLENYGFTAALRNADFVWTPRALDAWLARPSQFLPGNAMAYGGIPYADDRTALIASLLRETMESGE